MHIDQTIVQILLLLGSTVAIVLAFQRLGIPSSLAYLIVGVLLGPHTAGPVIPVDSIYGIAQFGIVFLLFTIGLNFSLPQIHALRHLVLGLGTAQVVFTTLVVGLITWAAGLTPAAAFVVGAVFAQSSTTIISRQLAEQSEDHGRHGRLGVAMSVFQDVTAVPFVVVIPVLVAAEIPELAKALGLALGKGALALVLVFFVARRLLRPLFRVVATSRSAELFTLTVLFVSLLAGWTTHVLGVSMAFGAFLAGMVLGETEFRHQVDSTIRPFRDVLLGLFFIGIGMLIDPAAVARVWAWAVLGAAVLLVVKTLIVTAIVRWAGIDTITAWRTGLLLAVGGEFGFALLALALEARVVPADLGQIVLVSVLFSMIVAPLLIRHNHRLAALLTPLASNHIDRALTEPTAESAELAGHVILCGYGRVGQSLGHFLEAEGIEYAALELDVARVREARLAGERVHYGDGSQLDLLEALGLARARLLVVTHADTAAALRTLVQVRARYSELPIMVRTLDQSSVNALRAAGASDVVPETLEVGLMLASQALLRLDVSAERVGRILAQERAGQYRRLFEVFPGDRSHGESGTELEAGRLHAVQIAPASALAGKRLGALEIDGVVVTALVRNGKRLLQPNQDVRIEAGDRLVLFGSPSDLRAAEMRLG